MAWVYILECADGTYYTGSTRWLETRVSQHQLGEGSAYTRPRRRRPVVLLWAVEFDRVDEAFELEKQVQGWSRAKKEALMAGRYDDLPVLARGRSRRTPDVGEARSGG